MQAIGATGGKKSKPPLPKHKPHTPIAKAYHDNHKDASFNPQSLHNLIPHPSQPIHHLITSSNSRPMERTGLRERSNLSRFMSKENDNDREESFDNCNISLSNFASEDIEEKKEPILSPILHQKLLLKTPNFIIAPFNSSK